MTSTLLLPLAAGLILLATLGVAQDFHGGGTEPEEEATAEETGDAPAATHAGPTAPITVLDGAYTQAQADRGRAVYDEACAACHSGNLRGTWNMGPSIAGFRFERRWVDLTVADLFGYLKEAMPKDDPGSLNDRDYADVVAYILSRNDYPAGTTVDIPLDPAAQALIAIVGQPDSD